MDYFVFKFGFWSVCLRYFEVWTSTGLRLNDSFSFRLWGVILFLVLGLRVLRFVDLSLFWLWFLILTLIFFCLDVVTGVWYTYVPNFAIYLFLWCKEQPWPLSPDLGLWRTQEVTDWGLATWSWFNFGHWSLIQPCSKFWLSILILKVKRTTMSLSPDMGFGRCRRFLYRVWHLGLDLDIVTGLWYTHFQNFGSILILKVQTTSMSSIL